MPEMTGRIFSFSSSAVCGFWNFSRNNTLGSYCSLCPTLTFILWNVSTSRRLARNINIREYSVKLTAAVPAGWISAYGLPNNIRCLVIHHILNVSLLQEKKKRPDVWHLMYDPHEEIAAFLLAPNLALTGSLLTLRLLMSYIYMEHLFLMFLDHTQRRSTVGGTPLDEWSARRRDLYLTTHDTHNRQTSMPPVGFEPTISARERPQTYALDRAATGTGLYRRLH